MKGQAREMRNVTIYDTIAGLIGSIAEDPQNYLRRARVIGVQTGQKLYGKAYASFFEPKNTEATSLPASASYFHKFVVPIDQKGVTIPTIVMTKPVDTIVALSAAATFNPKTLANANAPKDNHLRWKTSIPSTDYLTGYICIDDAALVINRDTFKSDANPFIRDIQTVRLNNGDHVLHVLCNGDIYEAIATTRDLEGMRMPAFKKRTQANTFLTIPHRGEVAMLIGTDKGLFLNDKLVNGTMNTRIEDITADSETNRVYVRSSGKYFGFQFDENWQPKTDNVLPIDDRMVGNYPWTIMLGGPVVTTDKGIPGIILSGWEKTKDGHEFIETSLVLELPTVFAETNPDDNAGTRSRNPRL